MAANTSRRPGILPAKNAIARRVRSSSLAVLLISVPGLAHAEDPRPADAASPPRVRCPPSTERRLLAGAAVVVPGVLVHGAGHYALCDTETARRLALIEAAGVGSALGSALGLALTGASRYVVAPLALGAIAGVGTFGLTWLADIYGIAAPEGGTGVPTAPPRLLIQTGLRFVYDRHFEARWLASHAVRLDLGSLWLEPRLDAALDAPVRRYALRGATRLIGARPGAARPSGDRLEIGLAVSDHAYSDDGFATTTVDAFIDGRFELGAVGPTLRGSFVDGSAGYARQWVRYDGLPGDLADELLARFAFGMHLGGRRGVSGETWLAYDHRRSTFVGGLRLPGIAAGYAGFVEQRTELFFGGPVGLATEVSYGAAFLASAYFLFRLDAEER